MEPTTKTSTNDQLSARNLSSSSSSSLHKGFFELDTTPNKHSKDSHDLASNSGDDEFPVSSMPRHEQSAEFSKKSGNLNQGFGATEAAAAETMREVIRENAASEPRKIEIRPLSPRHHSDESTKSFAFPILTGDVDQSESVSVGKEKRKKQVASQPQTPKTTPQSEPQTAKEGQIRWLACFSCCPFCS